MLAINNKKEKKLLNNDFSTYLLMKLLVVNNGRAQKAKDVNVNSRVDERLIVA